MSSGVASKRDGPKGSLAFLIVILVSLCGFDGYSLYMLLLPWLPWIQATMNTFHVFAFPWLAGFRWALFLFGLLLIPSSIIFRPLNTAVLTLMFAYALDEESGFELPARLPKEHRDIIKDTLAEKEASREEEVARGEVPPANGKSCLIQLIRRRVK
jgi:hypothetical protein